jgi:hypothetical protein
MADYVLVFIMMEDKMDDNFQRTAEKSLVSVVSGWFRSGLVEISCSSKIGHIRLMLNGLKNDKNRVARDMGLKVYSLLEKGELKIPEVKDFFRELRQIDKTIRVREAEIEQIIKDKEVRLLEVSGSSATPSWTAEPPVVKPAPKKTVVKKKASAPRKRKTGVAVKKTTASKKKAPVKRRSAAPKKPVKKPAAEVSESAESAVVSNDSASEKEE